MIYFTILCNAILFVSGYLWALFLIDRKNKKKRRKMPPAAHVTLEDLDQWIFMVQGPTYSELRSPIPGPFVLYPILKKIDDHPGFWQIILKDKRTGTEAYAIGFHESLISLDEIFRWFILLSCRSNPVSAEGVFGPPMPN